MPQWKAFNFERDYKKNRPGKDMLDQAKWIVTVRMYDMGNEKLYDLVAEATETRRVAELENSGSDEVKFFDMILEQLEQWKRLEQGDAEGYEW